MSSYYKKKIEFIRECRNKRLQESDYVVLSDVSISEEILTIMKAYRQELRDFVNKIVSGEMEVDLCKADDEFIEMYFPKLPE